MGIWGTETTVLGKKIRDKLETTQAIIVASFVLHNLAVQTRLVIPEEEREMQGNPANHALPNFEVHVEGHGNMAARRKRQAIKREHF